MRLICTNCAARYEVADSAIPAAGRDVKCTACGHVWFVSPEPAFGDIRPLPRRPVDPQALAILREEAAREAAVRAAPPGRASRAVADADTAEIPAELSRDGAPSEQAVDAGPRAVDPVARHESTTPPPLRPVVPPQVSVPDGNEDGNDEGGEAPEAVGVSDDALPAFDMPAVRRPSDERPAAEIRAAAPVSGKPADPAVDSIIPQTDVAPAVTGGFPPAVVPVAAGTDARASHASLRPATPSSGAIAGNELASPFASPSLLLPETPVPAPKAEEPVNEEPANEDLVGEDKGPAIPSAAAAPAARLPDPAPAARSTEPRPVARKSRFGTGFVLALLLVGLLLGLYLVAPGLAADAPAAAPWLEAYVSAVNHARDWLELRLGPFLEELR